MKMKVFTATDRGHAAALLRREGAKIPFGLFEKSYQDIILGKFRHGPTCKDYFAVRATDKSMLEVMKQEHPEITLETAPYTVIVVKNAKNDLDFARAIGL